MPVRYKIDLERRLIRTSCSGPVVVTEVVEHFRTLMEDPECVGPFDVLLDVSLQEGIPFGTHLAPVATAVRSIREKVQFGSCAIVAPGDVMFGMMRMFGAMAAPYFLAIRVFRSLPDAEAWLVAQQAEPNSETDSGAL
jgi:hypothetical protein